MEVHKITLAIIDFDRLGADGVREMLDNARYPNRCISPQVLRVETRDCGEWHDAHPLNMTGTAEAEIARLFEE